MSEQLIFEIKQKFLREVPHPKLIQSSIDRLGRLTDEALEVVPIVSRSVDSCTNFLNDYLTDLGSLKLAISNAASAQDLRSNLAALKFMHLELIDYLSELSKNLPDDYLPESEVKLSTSIDAYAILRFLKARFKNDNEIKEYLRSLDSKEENDFILHLIRSRQIIAQLEKNG